MRSNKHNALEIEIDLTAQELLASFSSSDVIELNDVVAMPTTCESKGAANTETQISQALDETSEIELTAEQMDAMLEGRWP